MANKNWIQKIDIKKGALTKLAEKKGGVKKSGGLKKSFIDKAASGKMGKKAQKQAVLAKTFAKMRKKK